MSLEQIIGFTVFSFIAAATPGPNNVLLTAAGVSVGLRKGMITLWGIVFGFSVMIFVVSLSIGNILNYIIEYSKYIKFLGAILLIRLAWQIANAPTNMTRSSENESTKQFSFNFINTALFQWVNPKAWIVVTDDPDLIAQAIIMSGAYEDNWKKHPALEVNFSIWQNKLPLYNVRMSNFSAAMARSQLDQIQRRSSEGLFNYEYVAERITTSPHISMPAPLEHETRAPDSIQFLLENMSEMEALNFVKEAKKLGVSVQIFGLKKDNARAFWNWHFLQDIPELKETTAMLKRVCDVKLPAWLKKSDLDFVTQSILNAILRASGRST